MDFVNSMSAELHIYLELISGAMLLMMAWLNHTYHASGDYSKIMTIGLVIASMEDLLHAGAVFFMPESLDAWIPFSWALTRFTILLTFFVAITCSHFYKCETRNIILALSSPLIISIVTAVLASYGLINLSFVEQPFTIFGVTVYQPLDFVLLILWIGAIFVLKAKSHSLFPPYIFYTFMGLGVLVHAVTCFFSESKLDIAFMAAHIIKVAEYYLFIIVYLLYKYQMNCANCVKQIRKTNEKEPTQNVSR